MTQEMIYALTMSFLFIFLNLKRIKYFSMYILLINRCSFKTSAQTKNSVIKMCMILFIIAVVVNNFWPMPGF